MEPVAVRAPFPRGWRDYTTGIACGSSDVHLVLIPQYDPKADPARTGLVATALHISRRGGLLRTRCMRLARLVLIGGGAVALGWYASAVHDESGPTATCSAPIEPSTPGGSADNLGNTWICPMAGWKCPTLACASGPNLVDKQNPGLVDKRNAGLVDKHNTGLVDKQNTGISFPRFPREVAFF